MAMLANPGRRRVLGLAGGAAAALGLGWFLKDYTQLGRSGVAKLKIVFFVTPDGLGAAGRGSFPHGLWLEKKVGADHSDFALLEASKELEPYRSQALFLSSLSLGQNFIGHNGHNFVLRDNPGTKASVDYLLGRHLTGLNPTLGGIFATPSVGSNEAFIVSHSEAGPRSVMPDPARLFQIIFGAKSSRSELKGAHLLDLANEDIKTLRQKVTGSERQKLDLHLDSVEQTQKDLAEIQNPTCESISEPDIPNFLDAANREQVQVAHAKVVAAALSCGLARVATIQQGRTTDQRGIGDILSIASHSASHSNMGGTIEEWLTSRKWFVKQARLLMDQLKALPDPDVAGDTLLQHTLVVFTSEMSDGQLENSYDMPLVLMGGASGLLQSGGNSGRLFDLASQADKTDYLGSMVTYQRIWSTLAQLVGTSVPYGGNIDRVDGLFNFS
ncbi:DUF1552 domain-containing protein [Dyella tabacisoli]|nr:DUF1552 domain-containing protein [Dyella tabacisoli]